MLPFPKSEHGRGAVLIVLQFVSLTIIALHAGPALRYWPSAVVLAFLALVMVVSVAGIGLKTLRVNPLPSDKGRLQTGGMYRWVRHPMYAATLAASVVVVWMHPHVLPAVALVVAAVVLYFKIAMEEAALRAKFPQYDAYARRVPALVPFLPGWLRSGKGEG